jgi:hypothetical protein
MEETAMNKKIVRVSPHFDADAIEWRRITDPSCTAYKIDFEYSLLGYDLEVGRLDMLLRYGKGRGHCRRHRHVAQTTTLVLDGEQHLRETQADGSIREVSRKKGDYAMAAADALPHSECGGEDGGLVLLSMVAPDGILFEYFDESQEHRWTLSIVEFVDAWFRKDIFGAAPGTLAVAAA